MAPKPPSSSIPHPTITTTTRIDNSLKRPPLKPYNLTAIHTTPPSKKPKNYPISNLGKENGMCVSHELETESVLSLDSIPSSIDFTQNVVEDVCNKDNGFGDVRGNKFYSNNSIKDRLIKCRENVEFDEEDDDNIYSNSSIEARLIKCRENVEFDEEDNDNIYLNSSIEARLIKCRENVEFNEEENDNIYSNSSIEDRLIQDEEIVEFDEEENDVCYEDNSFRDVKAGKFYLNNSIEARLIKTRDTVGLDEENDDLSNKESDVGEGRNSKFYSNNSIEARLIKNRENVGFDEEDGECELDVLLKLCGEEGAEKGFAYESVCEEGRDDGSVCAVCCPLCGVDISDFCDEDRQLHTNDCLDKEEDFNEGIAPTDDTVYPSEPQVIDGSPVGPPKENVNLTPVLDWLRNLGLSKYEDIFVREEIDWESLQWLTEEDLRNIGLTALGPRRKIVHALSELRRDHDRSLEKQPDYSPKEIQGNDIQSKTKLITDFFRGSATARPTIRTTNKGQTGVTNSPSVRTSKKNVNKKPSKSRKNRDIPPWCSIPGAPFRVDAFKYLTRECSHWFLTHFHMDHYQGLTRSFCHGKVYCSLITAKLVHLKIGIPWEMMQVLPLNQKIEIAGVNVTCFDANHCPGSIIILFEFSNGKSVLHTGDFRYTEDMKETTVLQTTPIHTLILDTTYCDPQYDFPKQEAVIQYVIEAIQAEEFNPKTLFLIGSYTIGKERLFLEIGRVLRKKIFVPASKLHILECLDLPGDVMQWLTVNEHESQIHVVPMWTLSTIKRLKHMSNQYSNRFNLIVAFSPTGWSFGKGKKKSNGRRWQQGTLIRYEVPYSEHSSFTELKEFVEFISPQTIIPSVNNHGQESSSAMISLLEQN